MKKLGLETKQKNSLKISMKKHNVKMCANFTKPVCLLVCKKYCNHKLLFSLEFAMHQKKQNRNEKQNGYLSMANPGRTLPNSANIFLCSLSLTIPTKKKVRACFSTK